MGIKKWFLEALIPYIEGTKTKKSQKNEKNN